MPNKEKLKEIENSLKQRYADFIIDGVADIDLFSKAKRRILWILKEANGGGNWSEIDFLKDVSVYPQWRRTFSLIIKVSYGILNDISDYNQIPDEADIKDILKQIALINIKKTGGKAKSDSNTINEYYYKDKDILLKQIEAINPGIIINASRVFALFQDLKAAQAQTINNFQTAKFKSGSLINAYHPNNRKISHKAYFENIMKCL